MEVRGTGPGERGSKDVGEEIYGGLMGTRDERLQRWFTKNLQTEKTTYLCPFISGKSLSEKFFLYKKGVHTSNRYL